MGMRKATVLITILAIAALPAIAHAKTGVVYEKDPATGKVGESFKFTVITMSEPRDPHGRARPVAGIHPLVEFKSASGRTLRVRASKTDLNGIGYGRVTFTDKGPWTTALHVKRHGIYIGSETSQPIEVGTGLVQTIPPVAAQPRSAPSADFPWIWVLSFASIGAALLVLVARRRGHWGAA